jgi:hypothetical protein
MKKLLFMMFLMGGLAMTFTSCGGDEGEEEETEEHADGEEEDHEH